MDEEKNMKTLDLTKILKVGDKVWSPITGDCVVNSFEEQFACRFIRVVTLDGENNTTFYSDGKYFSYSPECTLFPSKDHRVWDDEAIMYIRLPKRGDYLVSQLGNPFIYSGNNKYGRIVARDCQGNLLIDLNEGSTQFTTKVRYATPEEIKEFDEFLKSKGYYFDKEKLELKKLRWRANKGETYFYIMTGGKIDSSIEDKECTDDMRYDFGNYFKTKEEAEVAAKQIKQVLNNFHNGNN